MAHGAKKHRVVNNQPEGTHHAHSSLAPWNTDPADYPDYAFASLRFEGANKKQTHDAMVLAQSAALGPR